MIPPKIHYCWLSNDPMPDFVVKYIDGWKKILPKYEIIKWDLKRFPLDKNNWVRQAFEAKKYAFAADYIRLYALYTEGGIYLDSDVEVLRPFDDLLHLPYFLCKENSLKGVEAATIGAEKGCEWVGKCLDYYTGKTFVNEDGSYNTIVLPEIIQGQIEKYYNLKRISNIEQIERDRNSVFLLPSEFFSPKSYVTKKIIITSNTYSIHHFAGTWQPKWKKILLRIWVPFSAKYPNMAKRVKSFWR